MHVGLASMVAGLFDPQESTEPMDHNRKDQFFRELCVRGLGWSERQ